MSNNFNQNPWKIVSGKNVHESPWIKVDYYNVITPSGNKGEYSTVHFKNYAIGIIPLDDNNNTWIVGQYRFPVNAYSWEIPEGGGKLNIPPLESAKRELLEETGIKANKWTKLMEMHLSNSATDELAIIYVAQELSFEEPSPDENEQLEIKKIHFDDLFELVVAGKITDSLTVAAVLKTYILFKSNKL
jgi:8-oxo-dGTP pyrophosphatase MutT (NUDIX family)